MSIEKLTYPLLYFQLAEDAVLGMLLGTDYQIVEQDLRRVKKSLTDYLVKQYKKTADYPVNDLIDAQMRVIRVKVPPTFRVAGKAFQMSYQVEVPVVAILGATDLGHKECHFPLLGESFIYYENQDLNQLIRSYATNHLYAYPPDILIEMATTPVPGIDQVEMKVNFERSPLWKPFFQERKNEMLDKLTEPFPPQRGARPRNAFPEAAWEMEWAVNEVVDKLMVQRANVLIIGKGGVGKSAVLRQAMRRIHNQTKEHGQRRTFCRMMAQRITASTRYLGEWQEMVESLVQELKWTNGALWVEDIMQLLNTGGYGVEDSVAAFIQSYLRQGDLQLVGELTPNQLERLRTLLPGFAELFQTVEIPEMSEHQVFSVLEKFAVFIQQTMEIQISPDAQQLAFRLLKRYYPYEQFPGKGIRFLAQCVHEAQGKEQKRIGREDVIEQFTRQTGLPEVFLRDDLILDVKELREYFQSRIIGQAEAVEEVCNIVKIYKAGLNNPSKPITTLMFAGPTGVGKTACAKALADYLFGKGHRKSPMVRIDMSEFQMPGQLSRLIGDRYETGQLVKEIRERPFAVLLLDEIEKAHPSVYDALLTVLDEGIMADAVGRETDFRNTIIIMTTNLGAQNRKAVGYRDATSPEARFRAAIEKFFRPEFVNRLDHMVLFNALGKEDIRKIAAKELQELESREGIAKYGIRLHYSENVVDYLTSVGFDERYGARPLQRAMEDHIVHPLSRWLLKHPSEKPRALMLDFVERKIMITTSSPSPPPK
jgi:ATP-dependent Clp protease ATP-binding subunit ClpC